MAERARGRAQVEGHRERKRGWGRDRERERGQKEGLKERGGPKSLSHGCIGGLIRLPL